MQFRPRIPGLQTTVQRPTNRFQTQTGLRLMTPQIHSLNNQMAFASHSNVRSDNSWIRGPPPPVPPKPQKYLRPTPLLPQEYHQFPQYSQPLPSAQTSHYLLESERQTNQFLLNYGPLPPPLR